jgi:predicted small secreted protein
MKRIVLAVILVALTGCGTDAGIGEDASARLTPHAMALRAAAASGELAAAYEELAALRREVAELRQGGHLSEAEAADVLAASAAVEVQLSTLTPSSLMSTPETEATTTTTVTDETTTGEESEEEKDDRKRGQDKEDDKEKEKDKDGKEGD